MKRIRKKPTAVFLINDENGAMLTRLSKGSKRNATIFAYAMMQAGANGQGVSDALNAFFPN